MDEAKHLLSNLNFDNALSPQLRVDGGEFPTNSTIVDHLLDDTTQLSIRNKSILHYYGVHCELTLIALCRATSAKLQNFDKDIHSPIEALQSIVAKEEQALKRCYQRFAIFS